MLSHALSRTQANPRYTAVPTLCRNGCRAGRSKPESPGVRQNAKIPEAMRVNSTLAQRSLVPRMFRASSMAEPARPRRHAGRVRTRARCMCHAPPGPQHQGRRGPSRLPPCCIIRGCGSGPSAAPAMSRASAARTRHRPRSRSTLTLLGWRCLWWPSLACSGAAVAQLSHPRARIVPPGHGAAGVDQGHSAQIRARTHPRGPGTCDPRRRLPHVRLRACWHSKT